MDNFDLNGFIRDFKAGKNPYGETPQSLTESTTPEPTKETSKETYVNEFLSEVEAKLKEARGEMSDADVEKIDREADAVRDDLDQIAKLAKDAGEDAEDIKDMVKEEEEDEKEVEVDDLLSDLEDGPDVEDLYGDVTVSHGERKPYRPMMEEEEEDEEEVEVSDEVEVDGEEDMDTDMEEEGGVDDLENHLESALKIARSMGDEKLADQIGNTVTFFTRQYVAREQD